MTTIFPIRRAAALLALFVPLALASHAASAAGAAARAENAAPDCRSAAEIAEREAGLPTGLLLAIGKIESGRFDPRTGQVDPWPWSTDLAGEDHVFTTAAEAVAWTSGQMAAGRRSIDVGCFQVNLFYHPDAFGSLAEAFDPLANARYAARFLASLYQRVGGWPLAVAQYHSADPALGAPYGSKVYAAWSGAGQLFGPPPDVPRPPAELGRPWSVPALAAGTDGVVVRMSPRARGIPIILPTRDSPHLMAIETVWRVRLARRLPRVVTPG